MEQNQLTTNALSLLFPLTSQIKAIACPLVKDEEGYLSEWVAWHEMQGKLMI